MKIVRSMFTTVAVLCAALACVVSANTAMGKEKAPVRDEAPQLDENEIVGEAHIAMKIDFVKFQLDDKKDWENHEYVDGAKTLVIKGLDRSAEHTVTLTPRESGYEPVTLTIKPTDFKRTVTKTKNRTQTLAFLAHYSASFTKVAAPKAEKPADKPAEKPADK
jgi:hypothetical protein